MTTQAQFAAWNSEADGFLADHPVPDFARKDCPELAARMDGHLAEVSQKIRTGQMSREDGNELIAQQLQDEMMQELLMGLVASDVPTYQHPRYQAAA